MTPPYDAARRMASLAERNRDRTILHLPPLLVLTDPGRTPDPLGLAAGLAPGTGLVYRHFGATDRFSTAAALAEIADDRGLFLFVSADMALAEDCGAHGIHWPEARLAEAARRRARGDRRLFTVAAHGGRALRRARSAGMDAALLSPVFPSRSPSAGRAKGLFAASAAVRSTDMPVYALGGVDARSGARLAGLGWSGLAVIDAIRSAERTRT